MDLREYSLSYGRCTESEANLNVDGDGKQYNMDATVAYKQAALNAIEYLIKVSKSLTLRMTAEGN